MVLPKDNMPESPRYLRIAEALREAIAAGAYPPNAMLPSRRALAQAYDAAQPTVDRAVAALVREGLLTVDSRRGTFVAAHPEAVHPPTSAPAERGHTPARAVRLGVITTMHALDEGEENQRLWSTAITSALERSLADGRTTLHFVNRYQGSQELLPIERAIARLRSHGVEAIALAADLGHLDESIAALQRAGLPFVAVTAVEVRQPIPAVVFDNVGAGYLAAEHLLQAGHRTFGFVAPFTDVWVEERLQGVRAALADAGLPASALTIYPRQRQPAGSVRRSTYRIYQEPGYTAAREAIAAGTLPRALIAVNDLTAFGVLKAAGEAGLVAGRDFAIMGFDDHPDARFHGLTTQRPPLEEMGREAGRILGAALAGDATRPQVRLRPTIVPRASTRGAFHVSP